MRDGLPPRPRHDSWPATMSDALGHHVLVAGATGTLGRRVVRELLARGERVRVLARDPRGANAQELGPVELVRGDLTDPASLVGVCDDIDVVISCAGASMRLGGLFDRRSFMEVDFGGNANLLEMALTAGVSRFVYVSLFGARALLRTEYAAAHERFVGALAASGIHHTVVRPTGYFSFFAEMLDMAARGRVLLIGDGSVRTNPIDERDVATLCVDAILTEERELLAGGPEVLTRRRIAELAFEALGKRPRISSISPRAFSALTKPLVGVNRRLHALSAFGAAVSAMDCVAPRTGARTIADYFAERTGATDPASAPELAMP